MAKCWLNGEILDSKQAKVSVLDHGILYGDGVFEGIRFYQGCLFLASEHLDRLFESAQALCLSIPYSRQQLLAAMAELVASGDIRDGYIRLVVTRGEGALGIDPESCKRATVFIIADQVQLFRPQQSGLRLATVATQKMATACWDSRIKSLNYLNNILARIQARQAGADEAILLNQRGTIAEGAINNVFIVRHNCLLTPPVVDGALEGITRNLILQLAAAAGIDVIERSISVFDAYNAQECFLSGTGVELQAVASIDGRNVACCPGPVFNQLQILFRQYIADYVHSADRERYGQADVMGGGG